MWFKSKLRKRIEARIDVLKIDLTKIIGDKNKVKQSINTAEHCALIVRQAALEHDINLLSEMLK